MEEFEIQSHRESRRKPKRGIFSSIWRMVRRLPHFVVLLVLVAGLLWVWGQIKGPGSVEGAGEVEVEASEIEKILEMNTASQEVAVTTDTTYISTGHLVNLMGLKLLPAEEVNRLVEKRQFLIKAGSSSFRIVGRELFIVKPEITSVEENPSLREVSVEQGSWSAVGMQSIAIKAKSAAKSAALESGIIARAMINTEIALSEMGLTVIWEE